MELIIITVIAGVVIVLMAAGSKADDKAIRKDAAEDTHGEYGCLSATVIGGIGIIMMLALLSIGMSFQDGRYNPDSGAPIPAAAEGWRGAFGDDGGICIANCD